ncbi:pathogenesis-related protein PR-1 type-like [Typha angustifolia]|uniref:pathogenesis-related protein PR-1 type-like n=1 Tax=Typha angustifolia TaxID=59011 RepID=UPI003C2F848A
MALRSSSFLAFYVIFLATILATTSAQNSPQDFLDPHNAARAEVNVGPLSWDDNVAAFAQDYANQRAGDCALQHSGTSLYGENIYMGPAGASWTAANAVDLWVKEKQYYDYNSNSCVEGQMCEHYTQVVWANSLYLGCAAVTCDNGGTFITCNYSPPGNYKGERPY